MAKELMTLNEFCEMYSIGRNKAYTEARAGRLSLTKMGSRTMVKRTDAEKWLESLPMIAKQG